MALGNRNRKSHAAEWRVFLLASAACVALLMAVFAVFYASPFYATDAALARLADKTLPAAVSESEMQSLTANLQSALDQVIAGADGGSPESVVAQVGRAVVREVRSQLISEASRRLATREGVYFALYGWQQIADRAVTIERTYLDFPGNFSVVMADAADGAPLSELVFARSGFHQWTLIAIRPHWMRNQGPALLRRILEAGIQRIGLPEQVPAKP